MIGSCVQVSNGCPSILRKKIARRSAAKCQYVSKTFVGFAGLNREKRRDLWVIYECIEGVRKLVPISVPPSRDRVFHKVWYRAEVMSFIDLLSLRSAPEDTGTLIIRINEIYFIGGKFRVLIKDITGVSFGKLGADFINQWVKVEYIEGKEKKTALFKDGGLSGWRGILGGTKEIFDAITLMMAKPPNRT